MPRSLPPDPALAATLRRLREDRGLSLETVAFKSGVSMGTIARIELGHTSPSWVTVRAVASALGVTLAELGTEVEAEEGP